MRTFPMKHALANERRGVPGRGVQRHDLTTFAVILVCKNRTLEPRGTDKTKRVARFVT
jgi:hypothetical protein